MNNSSNNNNNAGNTNNSNKRAATYGTTGPEVRLLYPHVFEKYAFDEKDRPRYQVCLLVRKDDAETVMAVQNAVCAAQAAGSEKLNGMPNVVVPGAAGNPMHDGDVRAREKNKPEYAGCWYLNAKSETAPVVCDALRQPITDETRVYSGVYARARVHFYAFRTRGNSGIACSLDGLQILKDGEPLSNGKNVVLESFPMVMESIDDSGAGVYYTGAERRIEREGD